MDPSHVEMVATASLEEPTSHDMSAILRRPGSIRALAPGLRRRARLNLRRAWPWVATWRREHPLVSPTPTFAFESVSGVATLAALGQSGSRPATLTSPSFEARAPIFVRMARFRRRSRTTRLRASAARDPLRSTSGESRSESEPPAPPAFRTLVLCQGWLLRFSGHRPAGAIGSRSSRGRREAPPPPRNPQRGPPGKPRWAPRLGFSRRLVPPAPMCSSRSCGPRAPAERP